jgi:hypothetical protein
MAERWRAAVAVVIGSFSGRLARSHPAAAIELYKMTLARRATKPRTKIGATQTPSDKLRSSAEKRFQAFQRISKLGTLGTFRSILKGGNRREVV